MELALMDGPEGSEDLLGEGPENQQTNIKWVRHLAMTSLYFDCYVDFDDFSDFGHFKGK